MAIPWKAGAELTVNGRKSKLKIESGNAVFTAAPGRVYVLTPKGKKLNDAPMIEVGFTKQYAPCRLGNTWLGSRDGAMNHSSEFPLW